MEARGTISVDLVEVRWIMWISALKYAKKGQAGSEFTKIQFLVQGPGSEVVIRMTGRRGVLSQKACQ